MSKSLDYLVFRGFTSVDGKNCVRIEDRQEGRVLSYPLDGYWMSYARHSANYVPFPEGVDELFDLFENPEKPTKGEWDLVKFTYPKIFEYLGITLTEDKKCGYKVEMNTNCLNGDPLRTCTSVRGILRTVGITLCMAAPFIIATTHAILVTGVW